MPQNPYAPALQGLQGQIGMPDPRWQGAKRPISQPPNAIFNGTANDQLYAYDADRNLEDELEQNLTNTPLSDGYNVNRLKQLLAGVRGDMAESFIPGQQAEYDAFNTANVNARREGFGGLNIRSSYGSPDGVKPDTNYSMSGQNPLEAKAAYGRGIEQQKINAPIEAQRVAGEMDVKRQTEANKGLLDVAKEQSGFTQFADLIKTIDPSKISGVTFPNRYGGGGIKFGDTNDTSASILNRLQQAAQEFAASQQPVGIFGGANPQGPARAAGLEQAVINVIKDMPDGGEIDKWVNDALSHPALQGLTFADAVGHPMAGLETAQLRPDERAALELLWKARGGK